MRRYLRMCVLVLGCASANGHVSSLRAILIGFQGKLAVQSLSSGTGAPLYLCSFLDKQHSVIKVNRNRARHMAWVCV